MPQPRIVFMGTADFACPSLEVLAACPDYDLVAVCTQPDRPKGRELKLQQPPVKTAALRLGRPVLQPERLRRPEGVQEVAGWKPDLIVVAAYGQILPPVVLDLPRWGCLNVHGSLLPKYRGAAPIQRAILAGEPETGITIMKMDAGLDTGDILTLRATPIQESDTAQTLHDRLAKIGAELLLATLPDYLAGKTAPQPQKPELATHAPKVTKEEGCLDWKLPARALWNRIRAFTPWPGAYTHFNHGGQPQTLKVWEAGVEPCMHGAPGEILLAEASGLVVACGESALRVISLQREGKRRMTAQEFLSGCGLRPGQKFE